MQRKAVFYYIYDVGRIIITKSFIDKCRLGDKQALGLLYNRYSRYLMSICMHYVHQVDLAQDLLHDSFIVIITSFDTLRNDDKLESWMAHIVRNTAINYLKRMEAAHTLPLNQATDVTTPAETDHEPPPYSDLMAIIDKLPQGYAQTFKLSVFEGKSHKEIAVMLGISPSTSRSQLTRARALLRSMEGDYWLTGLFVLMGGLCTWWLAHDSTRQVPSSRPGLPGGVVTQTVKDSTSNEHADSTITLSKKALAVKKLPFDAAPCAQASFTRADSTTVPSVIHSMADTANDEQTESIPLLPTDIKTIHWAQATQPAIINRPTANEKTYLWSLALSSGYNFATGAPEGQTVNSYESYDSPTNQYSTIINNQPIDEKHHYHPFMLSLSMSKRLNSHWSISTGLNYTRLASDFNKGNVMALYHERQQIHYLGIPILMTYDFVNKKKWRVYAGGGLTLDIPVSTHKTGRYVYFNLPNTTSSQRTSFKVNPQWSVSGAVGVQYNITPRLGICLEPTAGYYFDNGTQTIRAEHPVTLSLPIGLRFSW